MKKPEPFRFSDEAEKFSIWRRKLKTSFFVRGFLCGAFPASLLLILTLKHFGPSEERGLTQNKGFQARPVEKKCEIYLTPYGDHLFLPNIICNFGADLNLSLIEKNQIIPVELSLEAEKVERIDVPVGASARFLIHYHARKDTVKMLDESRLSVIRF